MNRINRNIVAGVTASVIALSGMALPVSAITGGTVTKNVGVSAGMISGSESEALEKAILKAKSYIDVPASYSEFDHNSYTSSFYGQKLTVWNMTWSRPNEDSDISVTIDSQGNLISYSLRGADISYSAAGGESGSKLAKISSDEAVKKAGTFLARVLGETVQSKMNLIQSDNSGSRGYSYMFEYRENGVPVPAIKVSVQVDKETGEVSYYSAVAFQGLSIPTNLPSKNGVIKESAAREAYLKEAGLELVYYPVYSNTTKKWTVAAAYGTKAANYSIDAKTGKGVWTNWDNSSPERGVYSESIADGSAGGSSKLTPQEKVAVDKVSGLMTVTEAAAKVSGYVSDSIFKEAVQSSNLYSKLGETNSYYWNLSYKNGSATIDAKNGELLSFNLWNGDSVKSSRAAVNEEQARVIAEAFLKKVTPSRYKLTKLDTPMKPQIINQEITEQGYSFTFSRQENGVTVDDNDLTVYVNRAGDVENYYSSWNNELTFPDISKAISEEEAFTYLTTGISFALSYNQLANLDASKTDILPTYGLHYSLGNTAYDVLIDAKTGAKLMRYNPTQAYVEKNVGKYSDISGHKIEATVKTLSENGFYLPSKDGKFNPEQKITQLQFLRFLMPTLYDFEEEMFYKTMISNGIITAAERAPSKELTQLEAVKFIVRYMGLEKAAGLSGIYKTETNIANVPASDTGYVSLAKAMGIFAGDTFDGAKTMTNSEAATRILETVKAM